MCLNEVNCENILCLSKRSLEFLNVLITRRIRSKMEYGTNTHFFFSIRNDEFHFEKYGHNKNFMVAILNFVKVVHKILNTIVL